MILCIDHNASLFLYMKAQPKSESIKRQYWIQLISSCRSQFLLFYMPTHAWVGSSCFSYKGGNVFVAWVLSSSG
jgi:hypothetical protein